MFGPALNQLYCDLVNADNRSEYENQLLFELHAASGLTFQADVGAQIVESVARLAPRESLLVEVQKAKIGARGGGVEDAVPSALIGDKNRYFRTYIDVDAGVAGGHDKRVTRLRCARDDCPNKQK